MKLSSTGFGSQPQEGEKKVLNSELWHACAGPLVSLPVVGSRVVYFPQGHSEQVAASTNKEVDAHIPNYPSLPPQLVCQLHNLSMHADIETDEVYAQMTLQPLSLQEQKEAYLPADLGGPTKQPTNYFCKTLTASDTSTHGGFSVPRRAAEKVFPPLDFSQQPPAQELIAKDLHGNEWKFRHIFRGQPKRHLLTTGWSVFLSNSHEDGRSKCPTVFDRNQQFRKSKNEQNQLLLGIRRANRPQTVMPSSVLSSDSMHLGLLAAAAHAAATNSRFTIFYNPRASPSEFVIPVAKYVKAVYHTRVSVGMRFRMLFETDESSVRRYMGTITGIGDLDTARWPNSHWRSVKVGWDESTAGERQPRVSLWEIEPLTTFPMYPSPFPHRLKRPWPSVLPTFHGVKYDDVGLSSPLFWIQADQQIQGIGVNPLIQPRLDANMLNLQNDMYQAMASAVFQDIRSFDPSKQAPIPHQQFQLQNFPSRSGALMQSQLLHQNPHQQAIVQTIQENSRSSHSHAPNHTNLQQQQEHSFTVQQQSKPQIDQQFPCAITKIPQYAVSPSQSSPLQPIPSLCHQQSFSDSNLNPVTSPVVSSVPGILNSLHQDEASNLINLNRTGSLIPSTNWPSKRPALEPPNSAVNSNNVFPHLEQYRRLQGTWSDNAVALPPLPGRECSIDLPGSIDPQNHVLFGVSIDPSSLLLQNGLSDLKGASKNADSSALPFASNFVNDIGSKYSLNQDVTSSIGEPGLLQFQDNMNQGNSLTKTFVKVYKSGSFGRSLDISKFSNYNELRSELARMFGLEGKLEDPLRSGWQLVFVDRENDVLLLGDGPWPEFVNSVWCIKILSPQEVEEMGNCGLELLNSVPIQRLSNGGCEDYRNQQDPRNCSGGLASLVSLDY